MLINRIVLCINALMHKCLYSNINMHDSPDNAIAFPMVINDISDYIVPN